MVEMPRCKYGRCKVRRVIWARTRWMGDEPAGDSARTRGGGARRSTHLMRLGRPDRRLAEALVFLPVQILVLWKEIGSESEGGKDGRSMGSMKLGQDEAGLTDATVGYAETN